MVNSDINNLEIKELNFFQRLIGIIISPVETMNYLSQKPKILFGFLSFFFAAVAFYFLRHQLFRDYVKYITEAKSSEAVSLTESELSKVILNKFISTPIASVVWLLIITGLIFGLVKAFKGSGKFKQFLSIIGYANVIVILSFVYILLFLFLQGNLFLILH